MGLMTAEWPPPALRAAFPPRADWRASWTAVEISGSHIWDDSLVWDDSQLWED